LEEIWSGSGAWGLHYTPPDEHELRPTNSAAALISVLSGVTERYKQLYEPSQQIQFLKHVQLHLLMRYLICVRNEYENAYGAMIKHDFSRPCGCINSLYYTQKILQDWGDQVFFLELFAFSKTENSDADIDRSSIKGLGSVFDEMTALYKRLKTEIRDRLVLVILDTFKTNTQAYLKTKRIWKREEAEMERLEISYELCDALATLRKDLYTLKCHLSVPQFGKLWPLVCEQLNDYILQQLLSKRQHFHQSGGIQFRHDMNALFLIFKQFTPNPHNYFKDVKEAAVVLGMGVDEAAPLRRRLTQPQLGQASPDSSSVGSTNDPFADVGLHKLSPRQLSVLLSLRIDA
jgi:hypothetical protein